MVAKKIFLVFASVIAALWLGAFYFIPAFRGDIAVKSGIEIGSLFIRYYGLAVAVAVFGCTLYAIRISKYFDQSRGQIENLLPWLVVGGIIGARIYFVIFSWSYFQENILEIFQIWKGGLSIYGGIIGGVVGSAIFVKMNRLSLLSFFDIAAASLPLGQAIGRFGNFFNVEAFGSPTALPWKMYVPPAMRPAELIMEKFFHPTFLYEAAWNLLVFFVLWRLVKNKPAAGLITACYLMLYSIGRFYIESLRLDSFFWHSIRIDQITALAMIGVGLILFIKSYGKPAHTQD